MRSLECGDGRRDSDVCGLLLELREGLRAPRVSTAEASSADADRVHDILSGLQGVEQVLTRAAAAREYKLRASRIGELVVSGDQDTVFGEMDTEAENFSIRSHGSLHEIEDPVRLQHDRPACRFLSTQS